jgi:ribonuclease BN (tRNA processing enzyme)
LRGVVETPVSVSVTFVGSGDSFGSGGRFNTCFLIDAPGIRFCIDFGASSLIALAKLGIPHNSIDAILLTHLHGDHCGGVPFLLMDAMLGAKRDRPLTIAGPQQTTERLKSVAAAMMPGMHVMTPKFPLAYVDLTVQRRQQIGPLTVLTYPAVHTKETNPTSLRVEVAGKVIAYTGDGEWTEHMRPLADGADLFIAECYFYHKPVRFHLNYPDIVRHRSELQAKRLVLTHFSQEMLANLNNVTDECAHDGLVISI